LVDLIQGKLDVKNEKIKKLLKNEPLQKNGELKEEALKELSKMYDGGIVELV
jgi:uncharacterized membrane protein YcaP (DUF421 family)